MPRCSAVILTNQRGAVLLNLRALDDEDYPNTWDVIGGMIEDGETPEQCIVREMAEETGIVLEDYFPFRVYSETDADGEIWELNVFYSRFDVPIDTVIVGEGQEDRFFPPGALDTLPMPPPTATILQDFFSSSAYSVPKLLAAGLIPVNSRGEVLLILRDDIPGLPYPGHWNLVGGGVEEGESIEETLVRETFEEINLSLVDHTRFGAFEGQTHEVHTFYTRLDVPAEGLVLGDEGQALRFFSPAEVEFLLIVPVTLDALRAFFASNDYQRLVARD